MDLVFFRGCAEAIKTREASSPEFGLSVIRLKHVSVPPDYRGKQIKIKRRAIFERDNFQCAYCGVVDKRHLTIDHITPKSRGGRNTYENLISACMRCNNRKAARSPEEAGMVLLFRPIVPKIDPMPGLWSRVEEWREFLGIYGDRYAAANKEAA